MKLFEIITKSTGESYVRSYAWCASEEDAIRMFEGLQSGHSIDCINEIFDEVDAAFITEPSDCGFSDEKVFIP